MAAGLWDKSMNKLIIPRYEEITVLSFGFTSTLFRSGNFTYLWTKGKGEALVRDALFRELLLKQ